MTDLTHVVVREGVTLRQVLEAMTRSGKQIALVTDGDRHLLGLVTDGDVRKAILRGTSLEAKANEAMNRHPVVGEPGMTEGEALGLMRGRRIRHLPLLDNQRRVVDLLILDDLLGPRAALRNRAVIMAGGQGTRLSPLTESTPKPLLTVGGKPLLEILIERLRQSGIVSVLIAVHHKADMIRERLGDGSRLGVALEYMEEPEPLGTMGALPLMRKRLDYPFFVVNADILTNCDFQAMWDFHRAQSPAAMTVGVSIHQVDIPFGEFTLHGDRVTRVEEKPRKEFPVNAGIYLLDPSVIELIPAGRFFDATDLIRALLDQGRIVAAYLIRESWLDVGRHLDLEKANRDAPEEKKYRESLADELDGHGHTFFKRIIEWYTARVEQLNPDQAEQKGAEAIRARAEAEAMMTELDRFLAERVNRGAALNFKKSRADEPVTKPRIKDIEDGSAINSMWYRSDRLREIAAQIRKGEEPIKWPLT